MEIADIISNLNQYKSEGPNGIPMKILHLLRNDISSILADLFNLSFSSGVFPSILKIAKVIPIHKKSSKLDTSNYRPISILSNLDKIIERLMYNRLYKFLESNDLIYSLQFGFRKNFNTLQMQGHCMTLNINSTKVLNSNQTPIDVSDQPVYAITKELLYRYPRLFEKYCPIMGGLHIEQSLLVIHGQLIEGSGLAELLTFHNFLTIGLSAIVDASHIKRARYALQVTACTLFLKLQEASMKDDTNLDPYKWLVEKSKLNKMCYIWKTILNFELQILIFVRSQREGHFLLYRDIFRTLIRWYFSFDHFYYACWPSVHLFDLITLETVHKDVFDDFLLGHFCFKKKNTYIF